MCRPALAAMAFLAVIDAQAWEWRAWGVRVGRAAGRGVDRGGQQLASANAPPPAGEGVRPGGGAGALLGGYLTP